MGKHEFFPQSSTRPSSPQAALSPAVLRLGTRGSLLARTQSQATADALMRLHSGLRVELRIIQTSGDKFADRPLAEAGGKGLFTKEIELALLANEIDFAVHSLKDVPVTMPLVDQDDLVIAAIPAREDPRDVLVSRQAKSLADLPAGAIVGTGSERRRCQILAARPDLNVAPLRGNIDTRLRKLEQGDYAAIILALAGLNRLGRFDHASMTPIDPNILMPAAGQGALALQCRRGDAHTVRFLVAMDDPATCDAVNTERAVVQFLNGDCHSAIGALATIENDSLLLRTAFGTPKGSVETALISGPRTDWKWLAEAAAKRLISKLS